MLTYINEFLNEYEYPNDCRDALINAYSILKQEDKINSLYEIVSLYKVDVTPTYQELANKVEEFSKGTKVHIYTIWLLTFILMSKTLKERYIKLQYPEYVFKYSMYDIKYKAIECHLVKGIWGNFVSTWEFGFFNFKLFGFSALQFEPTKAEQDYQVNGKLIKKGTDVINVHIPRREKHLYEEEVKQNIKEAIEFFKPKEAIFGCHSWLLFPKNKEMISTTSHLRHFIDLFTLVGSYEYCDYSETWRLFDMEVNEDNLDSLPDNTSFRKGYIKLMKNKEKTGGGVGFYLPNKKEDD